MTKLFSPAKPSLLEALSRENILYEMLDNKLDNTYICYHRLPSNDTNTFPENLMSAVNINRDDLQYHPQLLKFQKHLHFLKDNGRILCFMRIE